MIISGHNFPGSINGTNGSVSSALRNGEARIVAGEDRETCPLRHVEEAVTSHKENGAAKLFSNLQLSGGCASLEERYMPSPN
jgi:hypothetical protein